LEAAGAQDKPLFGVPFAIKDNIDVAGLPTTAACPDFAYDPGSDATVVARLKRAGAIAIGKCNLDQFATGLVGVRSPYGIPRNALDPALVPGGSSSGSAVAVAAGLATAAVGTETWGSLVAPASQNGVVAIKPSLGLVSRDRIIPIVSTRDTAGPMARSVTDAAILLDVLAGPDPNDPPSVQVARPAAAYARYAEAGGLRGRRIGVVRLRADVLEGDGEILAGAIALLERAGAEVVELPPISLLAVAAELRDFSLIADHGFKGGVNAYLAATGAPVVSLAEVIAFNTRDPAARAPFGQDTLAGAQESATTQAAHAKVLERSRARARRFIDGLLDEHGLDALAALGNPFYVPYCAAGHPALAVPAGYRASGEPVGLTFVGRFLDEPKLIAAAFAFEALARARRAPELRP